MCARRGFPLPPRIRGLQIRNLGPRDWVTVELAPAPGAPPSSSELPTTEAAQGWPEVPCLATAPPHRYLSSMLSLCIGFHLRGRIAMLKKENHCWGTTAGRQY